MKEDTKKILDSGIVNDCIKKFISTLDINLAVLLYSETPQEGFVPYYKDDFIEKTYEKNEDENYKGLEGKLKNYGMGGIKKSVKIGKYESMNLAFFYRLNNLSNEDLKNEHEKGEKATKWIDFKMAYNRISIVGEENDEISKCDSYLSILASLISHYSIQQLTLIVLQDINNQITAFFNASKILFPFAKETKRLFDYDMCRIWVIDDEEWNLGVIAEYFSDHAVPEKDNIIIEDTSNNISEHGRLLKELAKDKYVIIDSHKDIKRELPDTDTFAFSKNIESYIVMPIKSNNILVGVFELGSRKKNAFGKAEVSVMELLSSKAGSYISNVNITNMLIDFMKDERPIYEYVKSLVDMVLSIINARSCSIYLREEADKGRAYLVASNGMPKNKILDRSMFHDPRKEDKAFFDINDSISGWVLANATTVSFSGNKDEDEREKAIREFNKKYKPNNSPEIEKDDEFCENDEGDNMLYCQKAYMCTPISVENNGNYGIIKMVGKKGSDAVQEFTVGEKNMLEICANCIGIALKSKFSELENRKRLLEVVAALAAFIDAKDPYTDKHSKNVQRLCERVGIRMEFDSEKLDDLRIAALLHDIGKIGIPDSILSKPSQYNVAENHMIRIHPELGASFINHIKGLENIKDGIFDHHEYYDGSGGYPGKKKGDEISEFGRIIAVADSFDAITARRPYKDKKDYGDAFIELQDKQGTQFDPKIVKIFCEEFGSLYETLREKQTLKKEDLPEEQSK